MSDPLTVAQWPVQNSMLIDLYYYMMYLKKNLKWFEILPSMCSAGDTDKIKMVLIKKAVYRTECRPRSSRQLCQVELSEHIML